jgi:hypothetical protein
MSGDILRETQISQFYRYAKISQLLEAGSFGVVNEFSPNDHYDAV